MHKMRGSNPFTAVWFLSKKNGEFSEKKISTLKTANLKNTLISPHSSQKEVGRFF